MAGPSSASPASARRPLPASGPAGAHRAAQGLQVTGQGLQLAPVVVGLVLGLAEHLRVAGSGVCQVRKLEGRGPDGEPRAGWGRIWLELCAPVGWQVSGKSESWAGPQGCRPGHPVTLALGGIISSNCDPWTDSPMSLAPKTVPGQGMNEWFVTESRISCAAAPSMGLNPVLNHPRQWVLVNRALGSDGPLSRSLP